MAKSAILSSASTSPASDDLPPLDHHDSYQKLSSMMGPPKTIPNRNIGNQPQRENKPIPSQQFLSPTNGIGHALNDTPLSTAPSSPQIHPSVSKTGTPKSRATTLDIPGLTRSKVSPDGRIAQRDVGSKLVLVMVGLPARGKSYIVKKIARYLNWMQHDCKIFNVGNLRRMAAGGGQTQTDASLEGKLRASVRRLSLARGRPSSIIDHNDLLPPPAITTQIMVNGEVQGNVFEEVEQHAQHIPSQPKHTLPAPEHMDQDANFFDPENARASQIREQVALETLDELLDYVLNQGGSVGILDATNSTLERRKTIMTHIRERTGSELNVLFLESLCFDENLLESNMRLKLSGPDYKDKDPVEALADFKKRVKMYEKKYVPLGEYEERHSMPYLQMIDVGRKVVSHQIRGFLQIILSTYLLNFNLAPRQIWLTRHGESMDNVHGKIGGDSSLSPAGVRYAKALTRFITEERAAWEQRQVEKQQNCHWPPRPGDTTPPNPEYTRQSTGQEKNFCVWTSMLKRSIETVQFFSEDDFDIKQMRMLDELNAGDMEGMTYEEVKTKFADQYALRKLDKLHYRYPGPGGEGYLDIINRLQKVIIEVERMTDHVLLVGHRSITRVLLAYFKGLGREDISDLDVPLGVVYMLEPKPYGVDFKAYRYNPSTDWFDYVPDFELRRATNPQPY
ncbi:hypothetical protein EPUS_03060 [Endocarpon pusillum Z07020]|uniref:6-phosphofructo-2-kinase domain-containing protein n=1 Tax=Endocarpon pusillum (strain Z07020 / HMAS-L-300199) TaxID=1263415 RepID=U1HV58_ENDPU|nr:uncharacterized protein EPUS_03060 [Endocarpon pusillum Z07020]ERF73219.1 hypothetical protein EPUS_03060 [Endocarpon pusillum Z07020]